MDVDIRDGGVVVRFIRAGRVVVVVDVACGAYTGFVDEYDSPTDVGHTLVDFRGSMSLILTCENDLMDGLRERE